MWIALAAAWGFAEATLFFVVPDVLLTWLAGFRPRLVWRAVMACLVGALVGGSLMFMLAQQSPGAVRAWVAAVPAISEGFMAATGSTLREDFGPAMLRAGFTGVPYKVLAVESGAGGQSIAAFLAFSVPARLSRWVLLVLVAQGATAFVRARVREPDRVLWTLWTVGWGLVYAVYFTVMEW
jgi:membrane protein YqaA with SNARE-associated domain